MSEFGLKTYLSLEFKTVKHTYLDHHSQRRLGLQNGQHLIRAKYKILKAIAT